MNENKPSYSVILKAVTLSYFFSVGYFFSISTLLILGSISVQDSFAQTVTSEGVSGDRDSARRDPVVTLRKSISAETVKLIADSYVDNDEYREYPIEFKFFINRQFFTSQLQSIELPGAIGVDIGSDIATMPFNYSVVATVLHPNRSFSTVIHGAAYPENLTGTLDCDLTTVDSETNETIEWEALDVDFIQSGVSTVSFSFEADNDDDETLTVAGSLKVADTSAESSTASGSITTVADSTEDYMIDSAELELDQENSSITSVTIDENGLTMSCS